MCDTVCAVHCGPVLFCWLCPTPCKTGRRPKSGQIYRKSTEITPTAGGCWHLHCWQLKTGTLCKADQTIELTCDTCDKKRRKKGPLNNKLNRISASLSFLRPKHQSPTQKTCSCRRTRQQHSSSAGGVGCRRRSGAAAAAVAAPAAPVQQQRLAMKDRIR